MHPPEQIFFDQVSQDKIDSDFLLENLTQLTYLDLTKNALTALPASMGNLSALTRLMLHPNNLTTIPELFEKLTQLKDLEMSNNELKVVPDSLKKWFDINEQY